MTTDLFSTHRVVPARTKAELLGLVQGILADGVIVESEAAFLRSWIDRNSYHQTWPGNILHERLTLALADGHLDPEEQRELLGLLVEYMENREQYEATSVEVTITAPPAERRSEHSPFDDPMPVIEHLGRSFVLTGDFACGRRNDVAGRIEQLGGRVASNVSRKVHYLIVGTMGSDQWASSNYGSKIEAAVKLRNEGVGICIVREQDWFPMAKG